MTLVEIEGPTCPTCAKVAVRVDFLSRETVEWACPLEHRWRWSVDEEIARFRDALDPAPSVVRRTLFIDPKEKP